MSAVEVRQLRVGEWRELRELRLEALRDAPDAFATTLAEATARKDERWQADAARGSGTGHPTFVAGPTAAWSGWSPCSPQTRQPS